MAHTLRRTDLFSMKNSNEIRAMTFMSMMLGVAVVLTYLESLLPPLPFAPPGIRLGLANVVVMYTLFFVGKKHAFMLIVLKSVFVILTRGVLAGVLSITGGVLSISVIIVLHLFTKKTSYILLSSAGAITFNFGQMAAASLILHTNILALYWPLIIIFGVMLGSITGKVLEIVIPYMQKIISSFKT